MAAPRCLKNEELNSALKSLAERGPEGEIFKKYNDHFKANFHRSFLPNLITVISCFGPMEAQRKIYSHTTPAMLVTWILWSFRIQIINEELLEYSLENPLHVKIKGGGHPVLKSCLVEETEYVATSALKNLHSAIFESAFPLFVDFLSCLFQSASEKESPFPFTAHLKNNATSPAVTLNITHFVSLRHFFVRSYNLFGIDYIESPEILEFLAGKVEEIMENPVRLAKHLIKSQEETEHVKKEERISKKKVPRSESFLSGKPSMGQKPGKIEEMSSKDSFDTQCRKETLTVPLHLKEVTQECCPVYRYHDLKDIYQEVTKKLFAVAFDDVDCKPQAMDPLEMFILESL